MSKCSPSLYVVTVLIAWNFTLIRIICLKWVLAMRLHTRHCSLDHRALSLLELATVALCTNRPSLTFDNHGSYAAFFYRNAQLQVSSVKKRVRMTGSGNLKRGQSGMRHGTGPKPRSRLRSLGQTRLIEGKQKKKILWMLGSG